VPHVFLLHKFEQRSHAEIAAGLGTSKNMVEKHVIKAMAHCRKRMDEVGGKEGTLKTKRTPSSG
jgi:DNA-directed RNA polymerase specialized sigma24 family protein